MKINSGKDKRWVLVVGSGVRDMSLSVDMSVYVGKRVDLNKHC